MGRFAQYRKRGTGQEPDMFPAPVYGFDWEASQDDAQVACFSEEQPPGYYLGLGIQFTAWNSSHSSDTYSSGVVDIFDEGFILGMPEPDLGDIIKVVARFVDQNTNEPKSPQSPPHTIVWT